jgi:hypothetical protein
MTHFDSILMTGVRPVSRLDFSHLDIQFFQHHLLKMLSFSMYFTSVPLSKVSWLIYENPFLSSLLLSDGQRVFNIHC